MALALFGGSFNPPHVGHLAVAEACADAAGLDRVLWVPAATPPHKRDDRGLVEAAHRLEMVRLAIQGNDRFEVWDAEVRRAGVSYTVDTVRDLASSRPGDDLALILGGDSLAALASWREPRAILDSARLVVYGRPGAGLDGVPRWVLDRTTRVEAVPLDVSSTAIRERIGRGQTVRYLVPDAVVAYAAEHRLYRG